MQGIVSEKKETAGPYAEDGHACFVPGMFPPERVTNYNDSLILFCELCCIIDAMTTNQRIDHLER